MCKDTALNISGSQHVERDTFLNIFFFKKPTKTDLFENFKYFFYFLDAKGLSVYGEIKKYYEH